MKTEQTEQFEMTINDAGELLCISLREDLENLENQPSHTFWPHKKSTIIYQLKALIEYVDDVTGDYDWNTPLSETSNHIIRSVFWPTSQILDNIPRGRFTRSQYIVACFCHPTPENQAEALYMHAKRLKKAGWLKDKYHIKRALHRKHTIGCKIPNDKEKEV